MHDRWNRGDFRGSRNSSTRITGHRGMDNRRIGNNRSYNGSGNFSGYRGNRRDNSYGGGGSFSGNRDNSNRRDNGYSGGGSFGGNRDNSNRRDNGYSGGVAVEASTGHKVVAETSVGRAVAAVPLADPTEVVLSAEAAHVVEVHLAAAHSVDLVVAARSVEAHTAVVMDIVADSEGTVRLTASAHAPQHSSYAVSHSWPCRNTQPEWLC